MDREKIIDYAAEIGADDAGIASVKKYDSPRSPSLESILPGVKNMIVMAYKELSSCESENSHLAMNGRLDVMEFTRSCNYKMARFIEKETSEKTITAPVSYPLMMSKETMGTVGEVSIRHAAYAAGLGTFGRHNIIIHPELGSRVLFTVVLTTLDLEADSPREEDLCTDCDECVKACPADALDKEKFTDVGKCLRNSQPYGIGGAIRFWSNFGKATPDEQKAMLRDPEYWKLYQASFIGFQYFCFKCMAVCPVCID